MIRRDFFKSLAATRLALFVSETLDPSSAEAASPPTPAISNEAVGADALSDGPSSPDFAPVPLKGNTRFEDLATGGVSESLAKALPKAPRGFCVCRGIPFQIDRPLLLRGEVVTEAMPAVKAEWLVFQHTTDNSPLQRDEHGLIRPMAGQGRLGEHVADYVIVYADGTESRQAIRRRHHIGMFRQQWGEESFQAVTHRKPHPLAPVHDQPSMLIDHGGDIGWGTSQTRVWVSGLDAWTNWLWAWKNPSPDKEIAALRFEPKSGVTIISGISAGKATAEPLRWRTRRKAILRLPEGTAFEYRLERLGLWKQIQLDMGQVISADARVHYPSADWAVTYNNKVGEVSAQEILIEYSAHPDARFHLWDGSSVAVSELEATGNAGSLTRVTPATRRVQIRVVDKTRGTPVPVKLHVHGESGEYLSPVTRHRKSNDAWFEDYAPEFSHEAWTEKRPDEWIRTGSHRCTYIDGETAIDLPLGRVYLEVSKGFEIAPVRLTAQVTAATDTIEVGIEKVLPWRERGWVTADTHVHFLSPSTARLEGSAEGVNVINLLASQWGELMTNVADFDGKTTFGSKEAGGDGEWLVRVGTENRQPVLGHISLLGYNGSIIAPMCVGGPNEAALGDAVGTLLLEWAERCKQQNGVVVLPHFPNPRCEHAAALIDGAIDAVEMTSWGNFYGGIDPYSLSDWYRYLNLGYFVAAVGGTDKMSAGTAVGTVRTYARIPGERQFTYDDWKAAVRAGNTFVTYGPLLEFAVDGRPAGSRIEMSGRGGAVEVTWEAATVTVPMSKIELVVNGEIRESRSIQPERDAGHWSIRVDRSSWLAVMIRGHYSDKPEIIAAHSSPVMIHVAGTEFFAAADAVTILDQIEGALAYIDTVGTRGEDEAYKRIRMKLTSVYKRLHDQLHARGHYHEHNAVTEHR